MTIQKSDIQIQVDGRPVRAFLAAPEKGGPGVLVLHAWWGLNPFFQEICARLAGEGFLALAPICTTAGSPPRARKPRR